MTKSAKFTILSDGYRKMFDQSSFSKSKDLGDMLRFLSGVVVQNHMSVQGMADLYNIKPDVLERFIKSTIEPLRTSNSEALHPTGCSEDPRYTLDGCVWFLAGPKPFSALLLRSHASTYFYLPSFFVLTECLRWL